MNRSYNAATMIKYGSPTKNKFVGQVPNTPKEVCEFSLSGAPDKDSFFDNDGASMQNAAQLAGSFIHTGTSVPLASSISSKTLVIIF